jgi:hypothetical protein
LGAPASRDAILPVLASGSVCRFRRDRLESRRQCRSLAVNQVSKANMRFQSFFMLMTVQFFFLASS